MNADRPSAARLAPAILYGLTSLLAAIVPVGGLFSVVLALLAGVGASAPLTFNDALTLRWDTKLMLVGPVLLLTGAIMSALTGRRLSHVTALAGSLMVLPVSIRALLAAYLHVATLVSPVKTDRWLVLVLTTLLTPSLGSTLISAGILAHKTSHGWPESPRKLHLRP